MILSHGSVLDTDGDGVAALSSHRRKRTDAFVYGVDLLVAATRETRGATFLFIVLSARHRTRPGLRLSFDGSVVTGATVGDPQAFGIGTADKEWEATRSRATPAR